MAVHTLRHQPLAVVDMGGCPPSLVRGTDLVTGRAELRRRGGNHGVLDTAEEDEAARCQEQEDQDRLKQSFHGVWLWPDDFPEWM